MGLQLYAPLPGTRTAMEVRAYARALAYELAPGLEQLSPDEVLRRLDDTGDPLR